VPLTVGTAGHIEHGKTSLVRALTGKDTDRLPEEQERGISIDLGYAPLDLGGGMTASLVDVPGHERFVRNMVAGATGIDLFLLVIDAGEGARAQTQEHLAILGLLGIDRGVVALTKADVVDDETLALALEEGREHVPSAPVVAVSAKTGEGLDELRSALAAEAEQTAQSAREGPTRLYVDRVFTLRGIGTVATGTLWSGEIAEGDELRAEPAGREVRVRSVQVHDRPVERAQAGQRVAVGLPGVERHELRRGDALVEPGAFHTSYRLDVSFEELEPIPDGARVNVHHGTSQVFARVVRERNGYAQLRLAEPVVAARGDRFVVRGRTTLGGGRVLDPAPPRAIDLDRLRLLESGDPASIVRAIVREPVTGPELQARGLLPPPDLAAGLAVLGQAGDWYFAPEWLQDVRDHVRARLIQRAQAQPLDPGLPLAEALPSAPWAPAVAPLLQLERRGSKVYLPGSAATLGERAGEAERLRAALAQAGANPTRVEDRELGSYLAEEGELVRLGDGFAIGRPAYEQAREALVTECERAGRITLARFRDLLGTSRRPAQLLLERFDADGITRRVGDERVLRRAAKR
jgi:selenocysteine-specific elongation factor